MNPRACARDQTFSRAAQENPLALVETGYPVLPIDEVKEPVGYQQQHANGNQPHDGFEALAEALNASMRRWAIHQVTAVAISAIRTPITIERRKAA